MNRADNSSIRSGLNTRTTKWLYCIAVFLAFLGYGSISFWSAWVLSPTQDESLHVAAGYSYWQENDFRMQPENGVLSQRWIGIGPALLPGLKPIRTEETSWIDGKQWFVAYRFLEENGLEVLWAGRLMVAIAGAVLLSGVFLLSRYLWGPRGGLISLFVAAFSPTLLAHSGLATSDVFLATTYLGSAIALAALMHRITVWRVLAAGFACGAAALSKYTAIVLAPYGVGLLVLHFLVFRPRNLGRFLLVRIVALAAVGILAFGTIWAGYGFRFSTFHPESESAAYNQPLEELQTDSSASRLIDIFRDNRIFPEPYLYGADLAHFYSQSRAAFFLGETGGGGWRLYFPIAFLAKSGAFVILGLAAFVVFAGSGRVRKLLSEGRVSQRTAQFLLWSTVWAAGAFFVFCLSSKLNIGHRHMLPVYPFLFVWIGALWGVSSHRIWRGVLIGCLAGHALWAVMIAPAFLSFINPFFGGPSGGHRLFADSSYDWGQETYVLKEWLEKNVSEDEKPLLAVFAPMRMDFYGIEGDLIFQFGAGYPINASLPVLRPGLVAATATIVSGPYFLSQSTGWSETDEKNYWISRSAVEKVVAEAGTDSRAWLEYFRENPEVSWETLISAYSRLRIKRLLFLLREKEPLARPSDTIFIRELTEEEFSGAGFATEPTLPEGFNLPLLLEIWKEERASL